MKSKNSDELGGRDRAWGCQGRAVAVAKRNSPFAQWEVRLQAVAVGSLETEVLTIGWLVLSLPVGVESFAESEEEVIVWVGNVDV